jgi:N-glycosylase/DNA lyase
MDGTECRKRLDQDRATRYCCGPVPVIHRCRLAVPPPFELPVVLQGHGWVALPPHRWAGAEAPWQTVLDLDGTAVGAAVSPAAAGLAVTLRSPQRLAPAQLAAARAQLAHCLRLHDDLGDFWSLCRQWPHLRWVARRGGGRLLRSPTLFEDLLKLLFTTNCTWSQTTAMTRNLVDAIGPAAPDGSRGFPSAAQCARGEAFFRDTVRVGYRARACADLAARFADGRLAQAHFAAADLPTAEVRKRLLALDGFGPYAAGQALRLLGHYDDLALDSWCRARIAALLGKKKPPKDAAIARRSKAFGRWAGLALWCELTAEWHGQAPAAPGADRESSRSQEGAWW